MPRTWKLVAAGLGVAVLAWSQAAEVARGVTSPRGLAVDPQGAPFVTTGGRIAHIPAQNTPKTFVETGGRPAGLAFDAAGDLYVADSGRKAILKITPWGRISVLTESLDSPDQIAVAPNGEVYFTDPVASRVYRLDAEGRLRVFTADVRSPRAVAASARHVFIVDGEGTIWRFAADGGAGTRFAKLSAGALALDEQGNLFVGGEGAVPLLSP